MMEITEVRIKLMDDPTERLKAFCSITINDSFVVRDLKIIEGTNGLFVAMPSRKLTMHCPKCRGKNHVKANYCNQCGFRFNHSAFRPFSAERVKLYADIAHPINSACREMIQSVVLSSYEDEKERSAQPGYVSKYDDYDYSYDGHEMQVYLDPPHRPQSPHQHEMDAVNEVAHPKQS